LSGGIVGDCHSVSHSVTWASAIRIDGPDRAASESYIALVADQVELDYLRFGHLYNGPEHVELGERPVSLGIEWTEADELDGTQLVATGCIG
jgi:hypothetical protein